ncbi:unnamed protein product [Sphacelaria rigidula]
MMKGQGPDEEQTRFFLAQINLILDKLDAIDLHNRPAGVKDPWAEWSFGSENNISTKSNKSNNRSNSSNTAVALCEGGVSGANPVGSGDDKTAPFDRVLAKLNREMAWIMCDPSLSGIAGKIARRLSASQAAVMLTHCRGHIRNLATSEHASPVLRTLLVSAGKSMRLAELGGATNDVSDDGTADAQHAILSLVSELSLSGPPGKNWANILHNNHSSQVGLRVFLILGGACASERTNHAHPSSAACSGAQRDPADADRGGTYGGDPRTMPFVSPVVAAAAAAALGGEDTYMSIILGQDPGPATTSEGDLQHWCVPRTCRVPASFHTALEGVTRELTVLPGNELQQLIQSENASRPLAVLLEMQAIVCGSASSTGPADSGQSPRLESGSLAMKLVSGALEWNHEDESRALAVVKAMARDPSGARFLLALMRLAPLQFVQALYRRCFESR